MNARQKRSLLLAVGVLAVLVIVLLAVKAVSRRKAADDAGADSSAETLGDGTDSVSALDWDNGSTVISLTRDEDGTWHWAGDADFPLDPSYPDAITETLSALTPQQTITDGDTLEAYELDEPTRTLTVTRADGSSTLYRFGKNTTDGSSCYLLVGEEENPVYIVDGALRDQLDVGIYDMMLLPELPAPAESEMKSIHITGAKETELTATVSEADPDSSAADGDAAVSWRSEGANVTDAAQELVSSLSGLTLSKCADYKPSAQAVTLCGLDTPRAVLELSYQAGGADKTFRLQVGASAADGSGYYVRVDEDSTVYTMSADALSALLAVADSGLSPAA